MAKIGRPPVLDAVKKKHFCALVSVGCGIERAAQSVGCALITLRREVNRDPAFAQEVQNSRLSALATPLKTLQKATADNWRAASWFIERIHPDQFVKQNPRYLTLESVNLAADELLDAVLGMFPREEKTRRQVRRRVERLIRLWGRDWRAGGTLKKRNRKMPRKQKSPAAIRDEAIKPLDPNGLPQIDAAGDCENVASKVDLKSTETQPKVDANSTSSLPNLDANST